jgi:hypothetical protein
MDWPVSQDPLPQLNIQRGDNAWTEIMDLQLRGWSVADIISIFDDEEEFFREWLESIGSRHVLVLSVATANLEIYVLGFTHSWPPVSPPSPFVLFRLEGVFSEVIAWTILYWKDGRHDRCLRAA